MSTSEAVASNLSLVTDDSAPPVFMNNQVLVIIGNPVVVFPANLRVPWKFKGTLVFTLAGDEDTVFTGDGIQFLEPAPFTVTHVGQRKCELAVNNDNHSPGVTGTPFHYELLLSTAGRPFVIDPTVENDPPIAP
jgi:hypothetical protein